VSRIEVDLKPGDLDQNKLILVKDFVTDAGMAHQEGAVGKTIRKCLMGGLGADGYYVRTYSTELEKPGTVVLEGTITDFDRGSGLLRAAEMFVFVLYDVVVPVTADPSAAHAKANVRIYKG